MGRTAGDAALDFEMKMLLDTKEAEASAARLEKGLGGVLSIFESIGKAAVSTVGIVGAALKAPADFDNFLGSLNTKISNATGELIKYRDVVWQMQAANRKPGSSLFGASPEDFQKITMGFARGAAEAEKYGKQMSQNLQGFALGAGSISKGIGIPMEETTGIITSFHRELGISYTGMEKFGKALTNIGRQSGMTATQTKTLFRTVTSLGRAYGLTGKNAEKFVLDSVAVGAAISKIGLDATEVLTKMNEVATGSEQGLIQSLLLGFKPSDPEGQLKAFNAQAKMITQMAGQAGEQFAPYLTRQLGDKLGLKNFSVEQIQAMSRGEMIESDEKKGETVQLDTLEVLKGIKNSQMDIAKMTEGTYATFGQHMQEGFTKLITFLQEKFTPAMEQLKNVMANIIPRIIPILEGVWDVLKAISNKVMGFFNMGKSPLATLGVSAAVLALLPAIPSIVKGLIQVVSALGGGAISLVKTGASFLDSTGKGAAQGTAAGLGGKVVSASNSTLWMSKAAIQAEALGMPGPAGLAASSTLAIAGTVLAGLLIGGAIGMVIDHFWKGESKDSFFDSIYDFFAGKSKANEKVSSSKDQQFTDLAREQLKKPLGERMTQDQMYAQVYGKMPTIESFDVKAPKFSSNSEIVEFIKKKEEDEKLAIKNEEYRKELGNKWNKFKGITSSALASAHSTPDYAALTHPSLPKASLSSSHGAMFPKTAPSTKQPTLPATEELSVGDAWDNLVAAIKSGGISTGFGESPLMSNIDATASKFNLRRTDKPGQVHVGDHKFARDFSLRKSEGSAEFLDDDTVKKIVASFDPNLYWANDEKTANPKLPKEERDKHVRHLHVQLKEQYRGMAEGGFGGGALDNLSGTGGMLVRDAESHDLLREIANKLGVPSKETSPFVSSTSPSHSDPYVVDPRMSYTPSPHASEQQRRNGLVAFPLGVG